MEELVGLALAENSCCYGCLSKNDVNPLHGYKVQNEALKAIFQTDMFYFCYLCKRRAQQAELFIQNVQSNQTLLENYHNLKNSMLKIIKKQSQPLINLSYCNIEGMNIQLGDNDESNVKESFPDNNKSMELKLELEDEENDSFDQMEIEYLEDEHADLYSDEEGSQLKLLKEEVKEEGVEQIREGDVKIKSQNKEVNKGKVQEKSKKGVRVATKNANIETIKLTQKQCMEERTKLAAEEKYINSPYKCESCIKMFNFKAAYDKHMEKHREDKSNNILQNELSPDPSTVLANNLPVTSNYIKIDVNNKYDTVHHHGNLTAKQKIKECILQRNLNRDLRTKGEAYLGCTQVRKLNKNFEYKVQEDLFKKARPMASKCKSKFCKKSKMRNCDNINEDARKELYEKFWKTMTWEQRRKYICSHVAKLDKKVTKNPESRRNKSLAYFLTIDNKRYQICKKMFLSTFGIKDWFVRYWLEKNCDKPLDYRDLDTDLV